VLAASVRVLPALLKVLPSVNMLRVALTGGIATGKSYVANRLRDRGIAVIDADDLAHGVTSAGTEATAAIAARFGDAVLAPDGGVDRSKLGPIVFADSSARRDLEAIVHPAVYRAVSAGLRGFELLGHPIAVVDVPLLYETGHERDYDRVIVTACLPAQQIERLMRRGLTESEAEQRLAAQLPTDQKAARADFVIRTDGPYEETDRQIAQILDALGTMN
jgi:dephospho-CoA kinase